MWGNPSRLIQNFSLNPTVSTTKCIAFPAADRVAVVTGKQIFRMFGAVEIDDAEGVRASDIST